MGDDMDTGATKPRSKSASIKAASRQNSKKESKTKRTGSVRKKETGDISAEIEMLTPKQNGSVVEGEQEEEEDQIKQTQSSSAIKGMWKKAFKSLKSNERQLSWKKGSLKRKDSKEQEEVEPEESHEIDPVYSLLKCAADLPKTSKVCSLHASCSGHHSKHGDSSASTSKTSSPSSSGPPSTAMHDLVANSLGSDFKQYYKLTSPAGKKVPSSLENIF